MSGDARPKTFLYQRLSVAVHRGNATYFVELNDATGRVGVSIVIISINILIFWKMCHIHINKPCTERFDTELPW